LSRLKQPFRANLQSISEPLDVLQADVAPATFDRADVRSMQAREIGELFLGESSLMAQVAEVLRETE